MQYDIDFVLNEIIEMFRNNLKLLLYNDKALVNLKEYCGHDYNLSFTPYNELVYFAEEALCDLVNKADIFYDFRDID